VELKLLVITDVDIDYKFMTISMLQTHLSPGKFPQILTECGWLRSRAEMNLAKNNFGYISEDRDLAMQFVARHCDYILKALPLIFIFIIYV